MFLLFVVLMFVSTHICVLIVFCVKYTSLCLYLKLKRCIATFDISSQGEGHPEPANPHPISLLVAFRTDFSLNTMELWEIPMLQMAH